ncbi:hypothetical protein KFE25_013345 [Diacronema lutheri]|uniref:DDHD domain-containing protein n=1 Tax=Diacronema lutheri TaxID=2081491 RepID=A0A8J6CB22_DIALT|nr:hypothetical protein KFE25_013345 [Diacronema lutheri]
MATAGVCLRVEDDGHVSVRVAPATRPLSPLPLVPALPPPPLPPPPPPPAAPPASDDEPFDPTRPPAVRELIFIVHGIGRHDDFDEDKCTSWDGTAGLRTGGNLEFRRTLRRLLDDHFTQLGVHVEVRAIEWHSRLRAHGLDALWSALTTMPANGASDVRQFAGEYMRQFAGEYLMDVLYYVQPTYGQMILDEVGAQLNARYADFMREHPRFSGGVSIIGHSLGSMIAYDLLGGGDGAGRGYRPPTLRRPPLLFEVNHFFAIGSPIAAFLISRGCLPPPPATTAAATAPAPPARRGPPAAGASPPRGTAAPAAAPCDGGGDADGGGGGGDMSAAPAAAPPLPPPPPPALPASLPAPVQHGGGTLLGTLRGFDAYRHALQPRCAHFWSLYFAIDPVARRIEPLMRAAPADGGWPTDAASRVQRARLPKAAAPSPALLELLVGAVGVRRRPLERRVDWLLPEQSSSVSDKLFALPAHSSYWASSETVLFVLAQICAPVGEWLEERARDRALGGRLPRALDATCSIAVPAADAPAAGADAPVDGAAGELPLDGASLARLLPPPPPSLDVRQPLELCCRMLLHDNLTGFWTDHLALCQGGVLRLFDPALLAAVSHKGSIDLRGAEVSVGTDASAGASAGGTFGYGGYGGYAPAVSSLLVHALDRDGRDRTFEMACSSAAEADDWFSACKTAQATRAARGAEGARARTEEEGSGAPLDGGSGGCVPRFFGARKIGWLRKRGHPGSVLVSVSWASRWFCLSDERCCLDYFDKEPEWVRRADVRTLSLRGCAVEMVEDVLAVRIADGRGLTVLLRANTAADFERWAPLAHRRVPTAALPRAAPAREPGMGGGGGGAGAFAGGGVEGGGSCAVAAGALAFSRAAEALGGGGGGGGVAGAAAHWAAIARFSTGGGAAEGTAEGGGAAAEPRGGGGGDGCGGGRAALYDSGGGVERARSREALALGGVPAHVSVDGYKVLADGKGRQYVVFVCRTMAAGGSTFIAHRRFSEFQAMHAQLQTVAPAGVPPPPQLPPTHFWNRFEPSYLQEKGVRLAEYLNRLCARCFAEQPRVDVWVEPLLRFLAMPSAQRAEPDTPMTPGRATESDGTEAPPTTP